MGILCAYDGSEIAKKTLLVAAEEALKHKTELYILYVIDEDEIKWIYRMDISTIWNGTIEELERNVLESRRKEAEKILQTAKTDIKKKAKIKKVVTLLEKGDVAQKILEKSKELKCSFIVMGSHGLHGIKLILGSTTAEVLRVSQIPVIVVKN